MDLVKKIWAAGWRIFVFLVLWAVVLAAFTAWPINHYRKSGEPFSLSFQLYLETASTMTILVTAWVMVRFIDKRSFISLGFEKENAVRDSFIGLVIGLGMMASCVMLLYASSCIKWIHSGKFDGSVLAIMALVTLLNTVTQEVLVRGYFQQTIQQFFGKWTGLIVSSLFFFALHLGAIGNQVLPSLCLFAAGVLLGTCYIVTGKLWLPIALHFGWNFLQGPVLGGVVSGQVHDAGNHLIEISGPTFMSGGTFGIEGSLVAVVITFLATPLILLIYRPRETRDP